ncbi:hypothetical protein CA85_35630 [Allorhodopirellula solitaria]|uniref:Uncharacterized protein n=1 Tax=Allorhodopirellula solitaria TaxID=2527987 RepID=A0A5C5XQ61_9BACT|nr:hypothetical protein CA85_35630 [Allorhodopirellula solitaria]
MPSGFASPPPTGSLDAARKGAIASLHRNARRLVATVPWREWFREISPIAIGNLQLNSPPRKSRRRSTELRPFWSLSPQPHVLVAPSEWCHCRGCCRIHSRAHQRDKSLIGSQRCFIAALEPSCERERSASDPRPSPWKRKQRRDLCCVAPDCIGCVRSPRHPSNPPPLLTSRFRDSVMGVPLRTRYRYVEPPPQL